MKKFLMALIVTGMCLLGFSVPVHADILPSIESLFFFPQKEGLTTGSWSYYANGQKGFVALKDAPGFLGNAYTVENGKILYISKKYEYEGKAWGYVYKYGNGGLQGWASMDQLSVTDNGLYPARAPGFFDRVSFTDIIITLVMFVIAGTAILIHIIHKSSEGIRR